MTKHLLKTKILIVTTIFLFSTTSCDNKEDVKQNNTNNVYRLNNEDVNRASNIIKIKDTEIQAKRISFTSKPYIETAPEEPYLEYESLLASQDLTIEIDSRTSHILDQTYEQNIQYLNDLNLFTSTELATVTIFKDELLNTKNFDTSITNFENAILSLPMTNKKLQRFYNFIDGLKVMNEYDPDFFKGNSFTSKSNGLFGSCLSASIGVGIAFVGLATIEVGSFGLATGVAVAGFIWASAEWGAACKGTGKKRLYPAHIDKSQEKTSRNFLILDENGDLIESPIYISYVPKIK
ncbi:hypothetical protein [Flavobacterium johnsoniae]|nr:hypothetical protein [Flavobacterium johnsoniae]